MRSAYRGDCIEYVVGTDVGDLYVVDRLPRQRWNVGLGASRYAISTGRPVFADSTPA